MPSSADYGKLYISLLMRKLAEAGGIDNVVDCGCGCGTYRNLLAPYLGKATWIGIEAWEPYIAQFGLHDLYHRVINSDLRQVDFAALAPVDLVIFGDVLEHMQKDEAQTAVGKALAVASYVLLSIPVVHYPQDEINGNPFEVHVKDDWDHQQVMTAFPGITAFFIHDHIGVYVLTGNALATSRVTALQAVLPPLLHQQLPNDRMAWGGWSIESHL